VPEEVARAVDILGRREGTTRFMTLLTAFMVLLHRHTGETDLVVGCPVAGRGRTEVEPIVGNFVNTLVMRSDLSRDPRVSEALARVRDTALGAYDHQDVPFDALVEALAPPRDLRHSPIFQVAFGLQSAASSVIRVGDLAMAVADVPLQIDGAKFDLSLSMVETAS